MPQGNFPLHYSTIFLTASEIQYSSVIIQSQHDEMEAKFFEERTALEDKYQKLYEPLYTKVYFFLLYNVSGEHVKIFTPFPEVHSDELFCVLSEV
jgi:hypothetical protein